MNIVVTDPDYKHSLGIVRSLGKQGYKPYLLSNTKKSLCSFSKFSNDSIILPKNFTLHELLEELHKKHIELIIIVGTNSFKKIVPWKNDLKKNSIEIVTVDESTLNVAFSKKETYLLAKKLDIPIPETYYPSSLDELYDVEDKIEYPAVIKGLYEAGGNIVDYAYNASDLVKKYVNLCKKYNIGEEDGLPMIQEYISGSGCAFFAVYDKGKCGLTFQHKRIREYPVSGGASVCAESYKNEYVEMYGKKLLDYLNWHGVAMVEFKLNSKGKPILMEINPKFWGSTDLALEAGVNFPKALIDIYLGKEVKYSNQYRFPFRYHWPLDGDILHGIRNPKAISSILRDMFNPNVKSNIWIKKDPLPSMVQLFRFFASLLKAARESI